MNQVIDFSTLPWVKKQLDETLKEARQSLEAHVENPQNSAHLGVLATCLHQVNGTLQMIELYGASTVVEEMEQVVKARRDDALVAPENACEVLMRAILQVPDYLDRLSRGGRDIPLVLLPVLNDLRVVRGETPLSEDYLFSPDLTVPLPESVNSGTNDGDFQQQAHDLRHRFQLGLLGWFKEKSMQSALESMASVLEGLQTISSRDYAARLWWVAAGLVDALKEKALENSVSTKRLMGQVDRLIKCVADQGEDALAEEVSDELLKSLLLQVGQARNAGERVAEIQKTFRLQELLPSTEELKAARESLSGQNSALYDTVASAVREELARLKDTLDIVLRNGCSNVDELEPLTLSLRSLGDTLGMLRLSESRRSVLSKAEELQACLACGEVPGNTFLMDVASVLLFVESAVDDMGNNQAASWNDSSMETQLAEREFSQVMNAVMQEALKDLTRAKEAIVAYLESQANNETLGEVPQLLSQVGGGLSLVGESRAAALMDSIRRYVEEDLLQAEDQPPGEKLNSLADAVCGVEYYLEDRSEHRSYSSSAIAMAVESVAKLGYPVQELQQHNAAAAQSVNNGTLEAVSEVAEGGADSKASTADSKVEATADKEEVEGVTRRSSEKLDGEGERNTELSQEERKAESGALRAVDEPGAVALGVSEHPGRRQADEGSRGAGEMELIVQPQDDGEPAAVLLLDDVATEESAELLVKEAEVPPAAQQEPPEDAHQDIESLPVETGAAGSTKSERPAAFGREAEEDDGLAIIGDDADEEILEIFIEEAEEEVSNIQTQLAVWLNETNNAEMLSNIRRSYHTLKGSGRLLGAMRIGEFAWAFENLLNRVIDGSVSPGTEMSALLQSASGALTELLEQIKEGKPTRQPIAQLMRDAAALSRGESPPCPTSMDTEAVSAALLDESGDAHVKEAAVNENAQTADSAAEEIPEYVQESRAVLAESEDAVCENLMDPLLYEVFYNETLGHLEVIGQFINRATVDVTTVDEAMARAVHTLHGSAHMAQAGAIAELAGELERWTKALMVAGKALSAEDCSVLEKSSGIIEQMLAGLPGDLSSPEGYGNLLAQIQTLREKLPAAVTGETLTQITQTDVCKEQENRHEPAVVAKLDTESAADSEDAYAQCDEELLEIFVEESAENLEASEAALRLWRESADDVSTLAGIRRPLHTLKGAARMANLIQIGDLAHAVESLITEIAEARARASEDVMAGVQQAQDGLVHMLDCVRKRSALLADRKLIERLEELREQATRAVSEGAQEQTFAAHSSENGAATAGRFIPESCQAEAIADPDSQQDGSPADAYSQSDPELLEVFLEEAGDIIEHTEHTLAAWKRTPDDQSLMTELQRELHTLKGGARMADITAIGDLAHAVESLMVRVAGGGISVSETTFSVLEQAHDSLSGMIEGVRKRRLLTAAVEVMENLEALSEGKEVAVQRRSVTSVSDQHESGQVVEAVAVQDDAVHEERRTRSRSSQELVRVKAKLLDSMVNFAGEVSIYRSRLEQQIGAYRFNLVEMDQTVSRIREQLRKLEIETEAQILFRYESVGGANNEDFDPLEMDRYSQVQQLSRSMMESISDLSSIQHMLENITRESETLLLQQSRVNTELQEGLMRTRMVPFTSLAARLRRIVRQTAQELGKKVELELSGAEGEMDRTVVDRIIAPVEHMLRNAISHGIETPEQRREAGKTEFGTIQITLERESNDVVLRIADDGAGMNLEAIRNKAMQRGMMDANSELSDNEILQFILETGFSTAEKVTQVAGRGVGMDVVNSEVKQLGGSLHIVSEPGKGATFTVRLPFTLALNQALLVEVGEDTYAIPLSSIEGVARMSREDLEAHYDDPPKRFPYAGVDYEVRHLGSLLGMGQPRLQDAPRRIPLLLARAGDHGVAFHIENLLGSREIVVKSVGPQISTVKGVSGATILGDGSVIMILDVVELLRGGATLAMAQVEDIVQQPLHTEAVTVMVVDDSITVRKVTSRLLERNEMNVITAKDGVDAVAKLRENIPDIMLLDIEMPRMDGFELATHVRNEPRLRNIPIIMITSRTGDKHRQRAMQIGVNRYLGKPFQEAELVDNIRSLLEEHISNG